jgi:hypothetical protein
MLFLLIPSWLLYPVILSGRTMLPVDSLSLFEPFKGSTPFSEIPFPHNALISDLILQNYPWQIFSVQTIKNWEFPLWNPYLFSGTPFLAKGQSATLYPLSILFHLFPIPRAYGLFILIHLFLAGLWTYLYCRTLNISRFGSLMAGACYELSGFLSVNAVFPMIVAGAAWIPLILTAIERLFPLQSADRSPDKIWNLIGVVALACQILAGHMEITYYTLLLMAFYVGWRLIGSFLMKQISLGTSFKFVLRILRMLGLGCSLAAIQLIPLWDILQDNFRQGGASLEQVRAWAYPWRQLVTFGIPNFFGNPSHHSYFDWFRFEAVTVEKPLFWGVKNFVEAGAYLGILPLLVALFAFMSDYKKSAGNGRASSPKGDHKFLFLSLAFLSFSFIFGTPLYALIYHLPGMNQVHSPFRWAMVLTYSIAVLAGYGAQNLQRMKRESSKPPLSTPPELIEPVRGFFLLNGLRGFTFWAGGLLLLGLVMARLFFDRIEPFLEELLAEFTSAKTILPQARAFFSYEFSWFLLTGLFLSAIALMFHFYKNNVSLPFSQKKVPAWEISAFVIIVIDLNLFAWGFYPALDPKGLEIKPPVIDFLKSDRSLWRFTTFDPEDRKTFNANSGWLFQLQDVRGYDSIFSRQYMAFMDLLDNQDQLMYNRIAPLRHKGSLESPLLDLLNVKYILTEEVLDHPKFRLVWKDRCLRVFENLACLPRAFSLPLSCRHKVTQLEKALPYHDLKDKVLLENPDDGLRTSDSRPSFCHRGPVNITAYEANQVVLSIKLREPSWLVLLDSYASGWRAYVRDPGTPSKAEKGIRIFKAYGNFRAVALNPGLWKVRFVYRPLSFFIGGIMSVIGCIILFFMAGVIFLRKRQSSRWSFH